MDYGEVYGGDVGEEGFYVVFGVGKPGLVWVTEFAEAVAAEKSDSDGMHEDCCGLHSG